MVVGNLDVGVRNTFCQCIRSLQGDSLFSLENSNKKITTHYQFRRAIKIAWLMGKSTNEERENQGMKLKLSYATVTSTSSLSTEKKAPHIIHHLIQQRVHFVED
jgi:hypothetical protein